MEQHPIPQQIASYQFKLVGDMTLKQFVQLAGGALISLLLYSTPLHPFIKWPLIIISFLFGVALAFLPIQDRPLSTWIFVFFRSIYSPTYFVWNKSVKPIEYFMPEETAAKPASIKIAEKKEEVQQLLEPVVKQTEVTEQFDEKEKSFLTKVSQNLISPNTTVVISTTPVHTFIQPSPVIQTPQDTPARIVSESSSQNTKQTKRPVVSIPENSQVGIGKPTGFQTPQGPIAQPPTNTTNISAGMTVNITPLSYQKIDAQKDVSSLFSKDVMPPLPATRENVVVGQVLDQYGQIVEGAILEIKDPDGRPVRALRSNKLGHFMIATPLIAGEYLIQIEKDGYEFEPYKFKIEDKIVPPIAIWAVNGGIKKEVPVEAKPDPNKEFLKDFNI